MNDLMRPRSAFALIFSVCTALIGYALYMQHRLSLDPCPMCIMQRYAFIVVGLVALAAAIHDPRGTALKIYGGLIVITAVLGGGVAIRHSWVQHFPPQQGCGADLGLLMQTLPLAKWLPLLFQGTGDCSKVDWKFIGLSLPEWALVWFAVLIVFAVTIVIRNRASQ